jgi:hypothetical protein
VPGDMKSEVKGTVRYEERGQGYRDVENLGNTAIAKLVRILATLDDPAAGMDTVTLLLGVMSEGRKRGKTRRRNVGEWEILAWAGGVAECAGVGVLEQCVVASYATDGSSNKLPFSESLRHMQPWIDWAHFVPILSFAAAWRQARGR